MANINTTIGKSGYALGVTRTTQQYDELWAGKVLPALVAGATMQSQRELYGRSEPIRQACRRAGFASIAEAVRITRAGAGSGTFSAIKTKGVARKVLAQRVAAARTQGNSWGTLALRTGMAKEELIALLAANGHTQVTQGRVPLTQRAKARAAKAEAAAQAAAAKPARKRTRKPKVSA